MAKKRKRSNLLSTSTPRSSEQSTRPGLDSDPGLNPVTRTPFSAGAVIPAEALKSIWLNDWWLSKAQGKGLGVTGFDTKGGSGRRLFSSAPISKRHDSTTLETLDGITVTLIGLINRSRTQQNGFPIEVCNDFLLGFPYYWEDYTPLSYGDPTSKKPGSAETKGVSDSNSETCLPVSLDDIPINRVRDFLTYPLKGSEECSKRKILDDVLGRLRSCASKRNSDPDQSEAKDGNPVNVVKSGGEEIVTSHDNTLFPRTGVKTRSMTRSRNFRDKEEDIPPSESSSVRKYKLNAQLLTSEEARNQPGENSIEKRLKSLLSKSSSINDDHSELHSKIAGNYAGEMVTRSASKRCIQVNSPR